MTQNGTSRKEAFFVALQSFWGATGYLFLSDADNFRIQFFQFSFEFSTYRVVPQFVSQVGATKSNFAMVFVGVIYL